MEKLLEQSVLARLPYGYESFLKQSISSEEDDMGISFYLHCTYLCEFFYSCSKLLLPVLVKHFNMLL